jgi:hypothetical protein
VVAGWAPSPPTLSLNQLKDARWLSLSAIPISARATAVVDIAAQEANYEATAGTRKTSRRQSALDMQQEAGGKRDPCWSASLLGSKAPARCIS